MSIAEKRAYLEKLYGKPWVSAKTDAQVHTIYMRIINTNGRKK